MNDNKVLIIGASGHAKVIVDILTDNGFEIAGLIDDFSVHSVFGFDVVGTMDDLPMLYGKIATKAFIAVGDNKWRKIITERVTSVGFSLVNAISSASRISKFARIGNGVAVMPGAVINAGATIGDGVIINTNSTVDHDCMLYDYVHAAPNTTLTGNVEVCEGAFLGASTTVIPKIHIGKWSIIGAGSVVIRDILDNKKVFGVPAKNN